MPSEFVDVAKRIAVFANCGIECVKEKSCDGHSHRVLLVELDNQLKRAARISLRRELWDLDLRGYDMITFLKSQRPTILIPRVYDKDPGSGNTDPLVLMDWVPGSSLNCWNHYLASCKRERLLLGLADFMLDLWSIPAPDSIQSESYSEWLRKDLDRALRRTLRGTAKWGNAIDYLIMRSMIPQYAQDFNHVKERGIAHGDMNATNVMVDDDMALTGIVDWDWCYNAPLPAVVQFPWFIADIPGWHNDGVDENESFQDDRQVLVKFINSKTSTHPSAPTIASLLSTSKERHFFQASFHFKTIHENFVRAHCHKTRHNISEAIKELHAFLDTEKDIRNHSGVLRMESCLAEMYGAHDVQSQVSPTESPTENLDIHDAQD